MPEIDLTKLYAEMQKEMLQKLSTGANAFEHAGTKGDTTGKQNEQIDLIIYDA